MSKKEQTSVSGQIIPKDQPLPAHQVERQPPATMSFIGRLKTHANRKSVQALADLEEAKARHGRAYLNRLQTYEDVNRQEARLSHENLKDMAEAESASIRAELSDAYRREQEALSALERQNIRDEIEDMQLELERKELKEKLNPPKQSKKQRKKHVDPRKRKEDEIERILKYGTVSDEGEILEAQLAEIRTEYGDDESTWPPEIQEKVRAARLHVLRKTTPGTP